MSKLSATATPFVLVTRLLPNFDLLVEQIKIELLFVDTNFSSALRNQKTDMLFSSDPIQQIPIHSSFYSINDPNFKRYLRSKAWRDCQREVVHVLRAYRSSRKSSSNFIQYLLCQILMYPLLSF